MRGDQKWPPQEFKQSDIDNAARKQLARGPVFRPRRVQKVNKLLIFFFDNKIVIDALFNLHIFLKIT